MQGFAIFTERTQACSAHKSGLVFVYRKTPAACKEPPKVSPRSVRVVHPDLPRKGRWTHFSIRDTTVYACGAVGRDIIKHLLTISTNRCLVTHRGISTKTPGTGIFEQRVKSSDQFKMATAFNFGSRMSSFVPR